VGGLEVHPGDLLHGDRHGLLTVPKEIAGEIPTAAARLRQAEKKVIDVSGSREFSVEKLRHVLKELS
jgi:regulator of RNase E activity RraA